MSEQLKCAECGFANEPERVYCHNCGTKLDRSLLPVVEQDKKQESPEAARQRIRKMTNPARFSIGGILKNLILVLIWAAVAAALILMARKPDGIPENKNDLPARLVQSELMDAVQAPSSRTISFSEADVNGALKQAVRRSTTNNSAVIPLDRAYARLLPNVIHLGLEQSLFGYPFYSGVDYRLAVTDGKFTPTLVGGNFGRLNVPPQAMAYLDYFFQGLWNSLKREHEQMARMQSITIGKGQIVFVTKGAAPR